MRSLGTKHVIVALGVLAFAGGTARADTPITVNCNDTNPCLKGNQSQDGGYGIYGEADNGSSTGVFGVGGYSGVEGQSNAVAGVRGTTNTGYGVWAEALTTTAGGDALYAVAHGSGYGVYATSSGGDGVHGDVTNGYSAVAGVNHGSGTGVYASSGTGYGVQAFGGTYSAAVYASSSTGYGVLAYGGYYGIYAHSSENYGDGVAAGCSGTGCAAIYASGDIQYTGALVHVSDQRLKRDVAPLTGSLDKLLELQGVSFYWKDPTQHGGATGVQRGFVAQDYEKVFPEWVKTTQDGYKMIDTTGLDSLEVESIRQLKSENDTLKKRLDALEASRRVVVAGNAWGWAIGGIALACAMVVSRKKREG